MNGQKGYNLMKKLIADYLGKGKRLDSRAPFDYRDIEIKLNISKHAEGSVSVKIGKTEVVCGIKMDVSEPYPDHEDEGTMMVTVELLPLSSPEFEYGPPRINAIEIARIVDRGVRESGFIDFKKLCIKESEKVWGIFIDLAPINDDGNLIDAAGLATVIALSIAKLPAYDEKKDIVKYGELTKKGLPLTESMPLTTTFYKISDKFFVDPTSEEAEVSEGRFTVELSQPEKADEPVINAMQKGGETTITGAEIEKMLAEATKIFKKHKALVEAELKRAGKPAK